ncbi:hypothetical protein [Luteimonas aquatica]|uniref:hypothetical protein n=1 Tax=Luteimonas aquatica TaxID=450364 RepID=UPI001F5AFD94|nr:hypothetical protein [Luteimonas aquatica]
MKKTLAAALATALALAGCQKLEPPASRTEAGGDTVTEWRLPAAAGASEPDLFLAPDGRLLLSWVKPFDKSRHALQFTTYDRNGQWQWAPKTIAVGASMLVNWADTPHIAATADGALWAHWLQKTRGAGEQGEGHAYDVIVARSSDDGMIWSDPIRAHDDGKAVEHGFVSFWPAARDRLGIAWLTGRDMGPDAEHAGHAQGGGATSLHAATLDATPSVQETAEVDAMVCDCCGTDVAVTARGPLLVYRDRTAEEIRDIHATRFDGGAWRAPQAVHADGWKMAACPVNGPAVAAAGEQAVVAWFSAANDAPLLQIARSQDAGDSFAAPVTVDKGEAVQGRVDVALDGKHVWVAWLREDAKGQSLWLARYAADLSREQARIEIARLQGRGRATGFPKLVLREGEAFLVWTDIADGVPRLQGARIKAGQ